MFFTQFLHVLFLWIFFLGQSDKVLTTVQWHQVVLRGRRRRGGKKKVQTLEMSKLNYWNTDKNDGRERSWKRTRLSIKYCSTMVLRYRFWGPVPGGNSEVWFSRCVNSSVAFLKCSWSRLNRRCLFSNNKTSTSFWYPAGRSKYYTHGSFFMVWYGKSSSLSPSCSRIFFHRDLTSRFAYRKVWMSKFSFSHSWRKHPNTESGLKESSALWVARC